MQFYFQHGETGLALDNEDLFSNMIVDLYNAEALNVGILTTALNIVLDTNKTVTNTAYEIMPVSGFYHTPTKPNVRITCSNIFLQATSGQNVEAQIRAAGVVGSSSANGWVIGATERPVRASALFTNLPIGVSSIIALYWRVSGGTGTCNRQAWLTWEIEEYD